MAFSPGTRLAPDPPGRLRAALVIATTRYEDPGLRQLRAPARDAEDLAEILGDPDIGAFAVTQVINADERQARRAIDVFLSGRGVDDLVVVYLSCHGVLDRRNRLYFAASDTLKTQLRSTGIPATELTDQLEECRARSKVLILDCCFSGAFAHGSKGDTDLDLERWLAGHGRGQAVLTASRAGEYSFEGEAVPGAVTAGSVFTAGLVKGLRTGAADVGGDGYVSVDEAFDYASRYVLSSGASQTPQRWLYGGEGAIVLARSPAGPKPGGSKRNGTERAPLAPADKLKLGATWDGSGTNFAVFSAIADRVELCLFDAEGRGETRVELQLDDSVWHGYLPGVKPGTPYGYRVHGPYDPSRGVWCNRAKLLLDPYARAVTGAVDFGPEVLAHAAEDMDSPSTADSAPHVPRSLVVDDAFEWSEAAKPMRPCTDMVIYDMHVKGFTMRHPGVPPDLRGTYAGLAHEAAISHLVDLGVTAVQLLPVYESIPQPDLVQRGLTNYWGYNTIGYFAPHQGYSAEVRAGRPGGQVAEFKSMVDALHAAGIEVILDVSYNYTAEADATGPTLSYRGLDNPTYYLLAPNVPREYINWTGVGNTLNVSNFRTLKMIMDSLQYWLTEMRVDGFQFYSAATLARHREGFDQMSTFFYAVSQDPIVSRARLIAHPWDSGPGRTYHLGEFPPPWREYNSRYRSAVRDFWRSQPIGLRKFASRFGGSPDLFSDPRRGPTASVNFITSENGFTLEDLVSYKDKHNEANGEDNRDGTDRNRSWNCGAEGPTDDPAVLGLRMRQKRAFLATLFLSQGIPMLLAGDELGRTQQGNNNAWCQDNEISWVDWEAADHDLLKFVQYLARLRRENRAFRHAKFPEENDGRLYGDGSAQIVWLNPTGKEMTITDWSDNQALAIAVFLKSEAAAERNQSGQPISGDSFLVLFNAYWEPVQFVLPSAQFGNSWQIVLNSAEDDFASKKALLYASGQVGVAARSLLVLRSP